MAVQGLGMVLVRCKVLIVLVTCLAFCGTMAGAQANDEIGNNNSNNVTSGVFSPSSCTKVISDGSLVTQNQWVDCSFGVQSLNLTADGEESLFVVLEPGGAFSLCTRQPFGRVFDDVSIMMWVYTPEDGVKDSIQMEILYSQQADAFAYNTGLLDEDDAFSKYTVEDLVGYATHSADRLSALDSDLHEGNWSAVTMDLETERADSSEGRVIETFPIYNRVSLRNLDDSKPVAIVVDSMVLVSNYTSQGLYVSSASRGLECASPRSRLPSSIEMEETFNSIVDISEAMESQQRTQIPLLAGVAAALVVVAISVVALTIVMMHKRRKLIHLYIPFEDLDFDSPPQIIGRGKFGYVVQASYNSFPVATKLVLPSSSGAKDGTTMFKTTPQSLEDSLSAESKGTVTYLGGQGKAEKLVTGAKSMEMYVYGKESNMAQAGGETYNVDCTDSSLDSDTSRSSLIGVSRREMLMRSNSRRLKKDFENEIRLLMKLRHPNIVTIMGVSKDQAAKDYVLVMERMTRGSLIDCLTNPTSHMDHDTMLGIMKDVADGMAYLHNFKPAVTHNDLRAANILVDDNFQAKISDFGLSGKQRFTSSSSRWPWTAPEIFGGSPQSAKTDVYSYGVLLIEIYTRCKLTVSDMKLVIPKEAPTFAALLIRQCLHPNPAKRPTFAQIQDQISSECAKLKRSSSIVPARNVICAHLPAKMAEEIRSGVKPSSTSYKSLTLLMSDIVGYTELTEKLGPESITEMLNQFYHKLDSLVTKYGLYKIETIGDAYFVVGGILNENDKDHCARIVAFAEEAIRAAGETPVPRPGALTAGGEAEIEGSGISIRIGVHSGPCVGAVVGSLNPKFSLYGDTVNVVSRIETTGRPDSIHMSLDAAELLQRQNAEMSASLQYRGATKLKGKGYMMTYFFSREGRQGED